MRIVFLPTTAPDIEWITEYYLSVFPEGGPKAYRNLERARPICRTIHVWAKPLRERHIANIQFHERLSL